MAFSIYIHQTPSGKNYVGQTVYENPKKRWKYGSNYKGNMYITRAINKYGWDNIDHSVIFSGLSQEEVDYGEKLLISVLRSCDKKYGYNIDIGGNSHSDETRTKISNTKKEYYKTISDKKRKELREHLANIRPKELSEETRKRISEANKGKVITDEQKAKISKSLTGRKQPKSMIEKRVAKNKKPVRCIETGEVWASAKDSPFPTACVMKVCRGENKTCGGFHWKYLERGCLL